MRQTNTQLVARQELALADRPAIHECPVPRGHIANLHDSTRQIESAVPPAEPAIVNADRRLRTAAQLNRKRFDVNLRLWRERIAADEAQFHDITGGIWAVC